MHSVTNNHADSTARNGAPISIIVPTLNEQQHLNSTLKHLCALHAGEIIVADGGSSDDTVQIAQAHGAKVVQSQPGRGTQLNTGAAEATEQTLLFLHADTMLPATFHEEVVRILAQPNVSAGAFRLCVDSNHFSLRIIQACANLRTRYLQLPYGDQALFMTREMFSRAGAFPQYPAMEDFCMVKQLQQLGRVAMSEHAVVTSARRWEQRGPWRTTALNQLCVLAYRLGVSPQRIARWRCQASRCVTAAAPMRGQPNAQYSAVDSERNPSYSR